MPSSGFLARPVTAAALALPLLLGHPRATPGLQHQHVSLALGPLGGGVQAPQPCSGGSALCHRPPHLSADCSLLVTAPPPVMPAQGSCIPRGAPSLGPTISILSMTTLYQEVPFPDPSPAALRGSPGKLWGPPALLVWHRMEKGPMEAGRSHSGPRFPKSKPPHSCPPDPLLVPSQRDAVLASTPTDTANQLHSGRKGFATNPEVYFGKELIIKVGRRLWDDKHLLSPFFQLLAWHLHWVEMLSGTQPQGSR